METPTIHRGLEGIYVDETSISDVDGENGRLIYRDRPIEDLVKSEFLDHTVRLNIAGFYYNYQQIQVQNIQAGGINTVNAGGASAVPTIVEVFTKLIARPRRSGAKLDCTASSVAGKNGDSPSPRMPRSA